MRSLYVILERIFKIAPDLKEAGLSDIQSSAAYSPPEMQGFWWGEAANWLNTRATNHEKREEIAKIFSGK